LERFVKLHPDLCAADVRPFHAQQWVDSYKLSVTSRRNYLRTVKRCLAWATQQGHLERNPVASLEIPAAEHREVFVTQADFEVLLAAVKDDAFRDLLVVTWESGCRPQESLRAEARHVDLANQRLVFPKGESKNKKAARIVYLTDKAVEIVKRLRTANPSGKLFRNRHGRAWTTYAVNCRFCRLAVKLGRKYSLYSLRHAWATNALQRGVDPLTVAILMGHNDPSMLSKVYQHLSLDPQHMLASARRAAG
jgi:integrase